MGKVFEQITPQLQAFIREQHLFFVATAPLSQDGHVNLSPKGLDCFRVLSKTQVAYLDMNGSGNETSAHLLENGRITFMFCALNGAPNIVRLYGVGRTILPTHTEWETFSPHFTLYTGVRQIIVADIHRVSTSCGHGIPLYDYVEDRDLMMKWAEKKGTDGLRVYQQEKNRCSIDNLPTPLAEILETEN